MKTATKITIPSIKVSHPFLSIKEKMAILKSVAGMWKNRKPDPIKELAKMRKTWERKLPKLH